MRRIGEAMTLAKRYGVKNGIKTVRKLKLVGKAAPLAIIFIIYDIKTNGYVVAAENASEDLLWPLPEMIREGLEYSDPLFDGSLEIGKEYRHRSTDVLQTHDIDRAEELRPIFNIKMR